MKKLFLIFVILICSSTAFAQKIVENPNCISDNISGKVTKVELHNNETILHFTVKIAVGSWIYIPSESYIEDSSKKGKRLYITKTDGIVMDKRHTMVNSDELRYKLYFPALDKDVKHINFGESNNGGNWFIFKLDLTKNGMDFLTFPGAVSYNGVKVVEGRSIASFNISNSFSIANGNSPVLPEDLPKEFFGNWYDKYGTLIMITTPDYIMSDDRIQYYRSIQKLGDKKFNITSTGANFEVLSVNINDMVIRSDKLSSLKRKPYNEKVPNFLKGNWVHENKISKINITDDYLYNSENTFGGKKSSINHIAESQFGDSILLVIYNEGYYYMYIANKVNGEYVLTPRGYPNAKYKKVKN